MTRAMDFTRDVSRQLIHYFGDQVFRTVVPRNVRLAEAPATAYQFYFTIRLLEGLWPIRRWQQKCVNAMPKNASKRRTATYEQKEIR